MGSDDKLGEVKNATEQFQSTLPRGERLYLTGAIEDAAKISIHAPAWGATLADGRRKRKVRISIHAPAWGATLRLQARQRRSGHFNPRSRVGSDGWCAGKQHNLTHHFNPRSRVGSDSFLYSSAAPIPIFQSTLPRGERRFTLILRTPKRYFNPRSRVGSDVYILYCFNKSQYFNPRSRVGSDNLPLWALHRSIVFQSTLPRGERRLLGHNRVILRMISIHAPAWGATARLSGRLDGYRHFNPRSRVGSDDKKTLDKKTLDKFQSTLPRGERHAIMAELAQYMNFNPRSRVGSDSKNA